MLVLQRPRQDATSLAQALLEHVACAHVSFSDVYAVGLESDRQVVALRKKVSSLEDELAMGLQILQVIAGSPLSLCLDFPT